MSMELRSSLSPSGEFVDKAQQALVGRGIYVSRRERLTISRAGFWWDMTDFSVERDDLDLWYFEFSLQLSQFGLLREGSF